MMRSLTVSILAGVLAGVPGIAAAQQTGAQPPQHRVTWQHAAYKREVPRRLLARTKVTEDSARAIAMARMPGAKVQALELENENGHLMWSWEMKLEGKTGVEEVNVNALDGSIIAVEHENPATERQEQRRDSTRARKPAAPARPQP
jgi:hypothetical protein